VLIVARRKLVGQRVTLENQIRGLAVVFGARLPLGLGPAFIDEVVLMSDCIPAWQAPCAASLLLERRCSNPSRCSTPM
jgi:transposase